MRKGTEFRDENENLRAKRFGFLNLNKIVGKKNRENMAHTTGMTPKGPRITQITRIFWGGFGGVERMKIEELQKNWNEFGELNPLWAVKTDNKKWDIKKFFETGEQEIKGVMNYIDGLNLKVQRKRALDFGCGR